MRQNSGLAIYTLLSLVASGFAFYRSILIGSKINVSELGDLSLVLSNVAIFSLVHFGFLSGSLRELSKGEVRTRTEVIELKNFLFFIVIASVFLIILIMKLFNSSWPNRTNLLSLVLVLLNLHMSWKTNEMIALKKRFFLGTTAIVSAAVSSFYILISETPSLDNVLFGLMLQPLIFWVMTLPPKVHLKVKFHKSLLDSIMRLGISLFLTTALFTLSLNLEKIAIGDVLGKEALGSLYLFYLLFVVAFLVPNSVGNFYYPDLVRAYVDGNKSIVQVIRRKIFLYHSFYYGLLLLGVVYIAPSFTAAFLPTHVEFIPTLFYALPIVLVKIYSDAIYLFLSANSESRNILIIEVATFISHISMILVFFYFIDLSSIETVFIITGLYSLFRFVLLLRYGFKYKIIC